MMSHSPLRMFRKYQDKCVLVSGQGPVLDIAKKYPFFIFLIVLTSLHVNIQESLTSHGNFHIPSIM